MRRRAVPAPSSLTSLVDVLFILVFAALVQRVGGAQSAKPAAPAVAAPAPWRPPSATEELRRAAVRALSQRLQQQPAIVARVSARGVLTSLEVAPADGGASTQMALERPLLERVDDPDIAVGYVGDRDGGQRLCALIAARPELGATSLERSLVVIAVEGAVPELMVALVGGLRRDVDDCARAHRAAAVIIDATALPPGQAEPRDAASAQRGDPEAPR
jgi:hypothetical protein